VAHCVRPQGSDVSVFFVLGLRPESCDLLTDEVNDLVSNLDTEGELVGVMLAEGDFVSERSLHKRPPKPQPMSRKST